MSDYHKEKRSIYQVIEAKDKLEQLQAELTTAKKQILDYEQIEASVCPEDVGIKEYVANLQAQLTEAKEEVKAGHSLWTEAQAGRKRLRLELDTASHENKRLRNKIEEAIDVLPTYPGCAKQRLIKALTGNDMANPETTKCKRCGKVVLRDLWLAHLHSDECEKLRLRAENKRLREELDDHAAFVYNQAILATPTGELRNKLTEFNILRLQALNPTKGKESHPQQYTPANKCITPGCGNLIDSNYCAKCREDWAS